MALILKGVGYRLRFFVSVYSRHYSTIPISATEANFKEGPTR